MITCNLDRLVFAFKQRSSDRSAAHRWNKKEMKRAMLRTKWNECREWDLMIFFLLHEKKSFQCCPYDRHGTTKEMTTTLIIRWECVYLSLQPFPWQMTFFDWFSLMSHNYTLYYWKLSSSSSTSLRTFFLYALRY